MILAIGAVDQQRGLHPLRLRWETSLDPVRVQIGTGLSTRPYVPWRRREPNWKRSFADKPNESLGKTLMRLI